MRAGKLALLIAIVAALCVIGRQTGTAGARFSHNGVITFIATTDFESSLRRVTPGQSSGFIAPPDFAVSSYAWAPTGSRIAYVATLSNTLWVQNGDMVHIADHVGTATWSPDGTRLAFTNETGTTLSVSDAAGTSIDPIVHGSGLKNPAWSPLGDAIVFEAGSSLKSVAPDGSQPKTLDGSHEFKKPAWSPFGDMIAVLSGGKIVVIDPNGVAQPPLSATAGTTGFSWSPDETMIAFNHSVTGGQAILIVPLTVGLATQVSSTAHFEGPPSWSPDGADIAYPRGDSGKKADIWMVGADGSGEQQVTDTEVLDDGTVGWQPFPVMVGDGDCSGAVDLADFNALMRYLAGLSAPGGCLLALNVRCGDALNAADAVPMLQYLAGLPPDLPMGCFAIGS
jgi:dipeptidyl aminopeptidase/acylaminoacyl peptidase